MKKNIIRLIAILAMCFMVVGVLASCGQEDTPVVENNNQTQNTQKETWQNPQTGTYWVDNYDTKIPYGDEEREFCKEHDWSHGCTIEEHTPDHDEIIFYGCLDCNYCYTEAVGHIYEKVETVAATCTEDGYDLYACRCGLTEKRNPDKANGHNVPAFNAANVPAAWVQVNAIAAGECPCEFVAKFEAVCPDCGTVLKAEVTTPDHEFVNFAPALPDATLSPCLQGKYEIAKCENCDCPNCAFYKEIEPATGHEWTAWTYVGNVEPTETAGTKITRKCNNVDCGLVQTVDLPALSEANGWTLNTVDSSCVTDGLKTYTFTKETDEKNDVATTFTVKVVINAKGGHKITGTVTPTKLPTTTETGLAEVTCPDCKTKLTYVLPVIPTAEAYRGGATGGYTIVPGTCAKPVVTFKLALADKNVEEAKIYAGFSATAEFTVDSQAYHPHDLSSNPSDYIIAKDENGVESYFALCQGSNGCEQWIYVGPVNE